MDYCSKNTKMCFIPNEYILFIANFKSILWINCLLNEVYTSCRDLYMPSPLARLLDNAIRTSIVHRSGQARLHCIILLGLKLMCYYVLAIYDYRPESKN